MAVSPNPAQLRLLRARSYTWDPGVRLERAPETGCATMGARREAQRRRPACGVPAWRSSWQAALLAASILSSCLQLTRAQSGSPKEIPVTLKPLVPIKGQDLTLIPGGDMQNIVSCSWYRGKTTALQKRIFIYYLPPNTLGQINGFAHTGRETGRPDCSLHIRDLTSADSGTYTVTKDGGVTAIGHANINVSESIPDPIPGPTSPGTTNTSLILTASLAMILLLPGMLLCLAFSL